MANMEIHIELNGIIRARNADEEAGCIVNSITGDHREVTLVGSGPDAFTKEDKEDMELMMFLPLERSPVRCTCRIVEYGNRTRNDGSHSARMLITQMSRLDRRRLELVIERKLAFMGSSSGYIPSTPLSSGFSAAY